MPSELMVGQLGLSPYNWQAFVRPDQFAVFHYDVASRCRRSPRGEFVTPENEVALLFDSLPEARQYCESQINIDKSLGLAIHAGTGSLLELHENQELAEYHHGLPSAHRALTWFAAFVVAALLLTAMDWWTNWSSFVGVLLATKFLIFGVMKFADGVGGILEHRRKSASAGPAPSR